MPKVFNKHHQNHPPDAVYVGRPTKWGNPYTHIDHKGTAAQFRVPTREEAVARYEEYLNKNPELLEAVKEELRDKDLVCFCAPLACHADILLRIANS